VRSNAVRRFWGGAWRGKGTGKATAEPGMAVSAARCVPDSSDENSDIAGNPQYPFPP